MRRKVNIDIESVVETIIFMDDSSEYYIDLETGKIIEIPYSVFDAIEEDYYEDLNSDELKVLKVAQEIYDSSRRYLRIPRLSDEELINVIMKIVETLDREDSLRDLLIDVAGGGSIKRKVNYLIRNVPGFYDMWHKHLKRYVKEKIKNWSEKENIEFFEFEV